jgi:Uma2 family endonuclease
MTQAVIVPTTTVSDRTWTVSDLERLSPSLRGEIIEGVLYMTATPFQPHPTVVDNLYGILRHWVRSNRAGRVYTAQAGLYWNEINYLDPDLIYVRPSQIPRRGQRFTEAALAVEVLSPSNLRAPQEQREERFLRLKVEEIWYVDHEARTLEVRRAGTNGYSTVALFRDAAEVTTNVFPGLAFPLPAVWEDIDD